MTHKEARQRIVNGEDADKVKKQFLDDKVARVNFDKIAFENVRKKVELKYVRMKAELDWCYYIFWQYGESCPFQDYDVLETKEASFELFTKICAELDDRMALENYEENEKTEEYPKLKSYMELEENGKSRITELRAKLKDSKVKINGIHSIS